MIKMPYFTIIQPVSNKTYSIMPLKKVLIRKRTKYQDVIIADLDEYGISLILDGYIQSTESDEHIYHEVLVHPAMVTHPKPEKVLVIGGGEGATVREVLKHNTVKRVIMVDIDGELIELTKKYLECMHQGAFDDPRLELVIADGKEYIEKTNERFDVVILDLTDPYSSEISLELYTEKFYAKVKNVLADDNGIVVTQAGSSFFFEDIYNKVLEAMKKVYPVIREYNVWIPSFSYACNFILASLKLDPISLTIEQVDKILKERNVKTKFYNAKTHVGILYTPIFKNPVTST